MDLIEFLFKPGPVGPDSPLFKSQADLAREVLAVQSPSSRRVGKPRATNKKLVSARAYLNQVFKRHRGLSDHFKESIVSAVEKRLPTDANRDEVKKRLKEAFRDFEKATLPEAPAAFQMRPLDFFETLESRSGEVPFLLAASFASPPMAASLPAVREKELELLKKRMSLAFVVPVVLGQDHKVQGEGALIDRYTNVFREALFVAKTLYRLCRSDNPSGASERVALFVIRQHDDHDSNLTKVVLPSAISDQRNCLVTFADEALTRRSSAEKWIVACWEKGSATTDGTFHVIHDPGGEAEKLDNQPILAEWQDYFQEITATWDEKNGSIGDPPADSLWRKVPLDGI